MADSFLEKTSVLGLADRVTLTTTPLMLKVYQSIGAAKILEESIPLMGSLVQSSEVPPVLFQFEQFLNGVTTKYLAVMIFQYVTVNPSLPSLNYLLGTATTTSINISGQVKKLQIKTFELKYQYSGEYTFDYISRNIE